MYQTQHKISIGILQLIIQPAGMERKIICMLVFLYFLL